MRHSTAVHVKLPTGEGWHYADLGRAGGYPLGYCAEHPPHATEDEARQCYQRFQRDHVRLTDQLAHWTSCAARPCKNPAQKIAQIEGDAYSVAVLCDDHWTIEDAIRALDLDEDKAGDVWHS